jgi:hypothetical protein
MLIVMPDPNEPGSVGAKCDSPIVFRSCGACPIMWGLRGTLADSQVEALPTLRNTSKKITGPVDPAAPRSIDRWSPDVPAFDITN